MSVRSGRSAAAGRVMRMMRMRRICELPPDMYSPARHTLTQSSRAWFRHIPHYPYANGFGIRCASNPHHIRTPIRINPAHESSRLGLFGPESIRAIRMRRMVRRIRMRVGDGCAYSDVGRSATLGRRLNRPGTGRRNPRQA